LAFVLVVALASCCSTGYEDEVPDIRQHMRDFVCAISAAAKTVDPEFVVIPQNGEALLTPTGDPDGPVAQEYLEAIDGIGREGLFYGYAADDKPTPRAEQTEMIAFLDLAEANGIEVLVTDYCWSRRYVDASFAGSAERGYVAFAADHRELDSIPEYPARLYNENDLDVLSLSDVKNFLYLINPSAFPDRFAFLTAIAETDYDLLIIDAFVEQEELTPTEIASLKTKANGGTRLVISYLSIGEAEDYRYYWQPQWSQNPPSWLLGENPDWPGNHKVHYWDSEWQAIIYGNRYSYLAKILSAGFDGVYLDLIDAFETFEPKLFPFSLFQNVSHHARGQPYPLLNH